MTDTRFDIIIPFRDRGNDPHRPANLASAIAWWRDHGVEPIIVDDGRTGADQFNRSACYNRGAELSQAPVLVYSEADLLVPMEQILESVELAQSAPGLVIPFSRFMSMDKDDSAKVRSRTMHPFDAKAEQVRGDCQSIGAVNVLSRESLALVGRFDDVFDGHAFDDDATEYAFRICCGPTRFVRGPGWHQWHVPGAFYATPESTAEDRAATERNKRRWELYRAATTPDEIRHLTAGALGALRNPTQEVRMTPDQITIYVPPTNCPKCMATKKSFDKAGIAYTVAEMTPEQADEFRERGFTVAPVVHNVHGRYEGWWSGFRTRKIEAAIAHRRNGDG